MKKYKPDLSFICEVRELKIGSVPFKLVTDTRIPDGTLYLVNSRNNITLEVVNIGTQNNKVAETTFTNTQRGEIMATFRPARSGRVLGGEFAETGPF
jgi:hypothetical protein